MTVSVLILGSGPDVIRCKGWDLSAYAAIVAINNAWRVRVDWTHSIYPDDFAQDRRPLAGMGQRIVRSEDYIPAQNRFGGVVYAGATMAFTASYWALDALCPDAIAYLGCDMMYDRPGRTHFYGAGAADPLRDDPTLQSLEAKSARLQALAAGQGCALVNLSGGASRLTFPRSYVRAQTDSAPRPVAFDSDTVTGIRAREEALGACVPSGRYWEQPERLDTAALAKIDGLWLALANDKRRATGRT